MLSFNRKAALSDYGTFGLSGALSNRLAPVAACTFSAGLLRIKGQHEPGTCRREKLTRTQVGTILAMPQPESRAASCFQDPHLSF